MFPSLIIPTRNKCLFLARTLASLSQQSEMRFEVVVVDDGSDDDTRDVARRFASDLDLRYIRRAHKGRSAARNAAIHAARGDLLIFCDDDRLAARDFVRDHAAAHGAGSAPLVALGRQRGILTLWSRDWNIAATAVADVIAARPIIATQLTQARAELVSIDDIRERLDEVISLHGLDEPWWVNHVLPVLEAFGPDMAGFAFPWTTGVTGNLSVPRAIAEQVGLFDESFVGWGLEDTDFHFRLHSAGARTRILDGALNHHQIHARPGEQVLEWGRNAIRMLEKYDSLEICLYLRIVRRRLSILEANRIALEYAATGDSMRATVAELVRLNKEHFRVLAQATL
jgi:glycosyltransferase involved in cell wall biosynthesis